MRMTNIILSSILFALSSSAGGTLIPISNSDDLKDESREEVKKNEEKEVIDYITFDQFSEELHVSNRPLKIKIYNDVNELIIKWQGNGHQVKSNVKKFLSKATLGKYLVSVFESDGTQKKLILVN